METKNQPIHQTVTYIIRDGEQEGWEFVCPTCGYRARYTPHAPSGQQQLEVLAIGDPQVRHASNGMPLVQVREESLDMVDNDVDEPWLTPEVRQQWEELLADVDIDDYW